MARSAARSRGFVCTAAFTTQPSITGTAQSGQTLTASDGAVARGMVTGRQWRRGGVSIAGATGASYTLQAADVGAQVTVAVTAVATQNAANTVTAVSPPTAIVTA